MLETISPAVAEDIMVFKVMLLSYCMNIVRKHLLS